MKKIIITIDGHSACGKSTLARSLAQELDYGYIDTGAMYRAVTYFFLENRVNIQKTSELERALPKIKITFKSTVMGNRTYLNGQDVEDTIRKMFVSKNVSHVAAISAVRRIVVKQQKEMGRQKGIVMEGRDIGTVVFPEAKLKIFLTADEDVRAQRRYNEIKKKGQNTSLKAIKQNLLERDHIDSTRKDSPLKKAKEAILIDNSNLTMREQLHMVLALAKERIRQENIVPKKQVATAKKTNSKSPAANKPTSKRPTPKPSKSNNQRSNSTRSQKDSRASNPRNTRNNPTQKPSSSNPQRNNSPAPQKNSKPTSRVNRNNPTQKPNTPTHQKVNKPVIKKEAEKKVVGKKPTRKPSNSTAQRSNSSAPQKNSKPNNPRVTKNNPTQKPNTSTNQKNTKPVIKKETKSKVANKNASPKPSNSTKRKPAPTPKKKESTTTRSIKKQSSPKENPKPNTRKSPPKTAAQNKKSSKSTTTKSRNTSKEVKKTIPKKVVKKPTTTKK